MKNGVLFFDKLMKIHLNKDVGMFPVYLSQLGYNFKMVCLDIPENKNLPKNFHGVEIVKIKPFTLFNKIPLLKRLNIPQILYICKNFKNIDLLFFFHMTVKKLYPIRLYKFLKKTGQVYLKIDMDLRQLDIFKNEFSSNKRWRRKILSLINSCNLVSSEIQKVMNTLNNLLKDHTDTVIKYIPNGIDLNNLNTIDVKGVDEKKNQMITVCRVGTEQKNNQMMLEALKSVDLKSWNIIFIGPIEDEFNTVIDDFYQQNPDLKEKVIFKGSVYDKDELYDLYNSSKVFFLTSKREGFPLSTLESLYFGNYQIQTPTGNEKDVISGSGFGKVIGMNDIAELSQVLNMIVNDEIEMKTPEVISKNAIEKFSYENLAKNILFNLQSESA